MRRAGDDARAARRPRPGRVRGATAPGGDVSFVDELGELYRTGARILYVVTEEEERAEALCRAALGGGPSGAGAAVAIWSRARGLEPIAPAAREPLAALEALFAGPPDAPAVALLLDFHHELEDRAVARRLRDL